MSKRSDQQENQYRHGVRTQAEAELRMEIHREDVDKLKVLMRARSAKYARYRKFWVLIKAAFNELAG